MVKFDLIFNYEEALKRLNRSQEEVDTLRSLLKPNDVVPESVTDKLVYVFTNHCLKNVLKRECFSSFAF